MKTHRCKYSLANCVSIRQSDNHYDFETRELTNSWGLFKLEHDMDYDIKYLSHIAEIKYCPFCSAELELEGVE